MLRFFDSRRPLIPLGWVDFTQERYRPLLLGCLVLVLVTGFFTVRNFRITTDLSEMISEDVPFRQTAREFREHFPQLEDTLVLVIKAPTPEQTTRIRQGLAERMRQRPELFQSVYTPGGGPFFERNGLLYLQEERLQDVADRVAEVQPFLAMLTPELSLDRLFGVVGTVLERAGDEAAGGERIVGLVDRLNAALERSLREERPKPVSWQGLMLGEEGLRGKAERFIIVEPRVQEHELPPGKAAIRTVRSMAGEMGLQDEAGAEVAFTGKVARNYEDLRSVRRGIGGATAASFVLVGITLYIGLGSLRMVLVSLASLGAGLLLTMGFAIGFVGRLNLISITFVVLFIGLGIDYSIQLCLRYQEVRRADVDHAGAVRMAISDIGNALLLCSVTTAMAFYSFVPTAYAGASELGLIAGTGMIINCLVNLTLLPVLLKATTFMPDRRKPILGLRSGLPHSMNRHATPILAAAGVAAVVSLALLPRMEFDYNPLHLSSPEAESVVTAKELLRESGGSLWSVSAVADTEHQAQGLADRLRAQPEVARAVTLSDLVPENQPGKLDIITDMALFMPAGLGGAEIVASSRDSLRRTLLETSRKVAELLGKRPDLDKERRTLWERYRRNAIRAASGLKAREGNELAERLRHVLLPNLLHLMKTLDSLLQASSFRAGDLPERLRHRYRSPQGVYRVQTFPEGNLMQRDVLERFVKAVRSVAPESTGTPVRILEAGKTISQAFRNATLWALLLIGGFLVLVVRSPLDTALVLFCLLASLLFTAGGSVLAGIALNFANIIVIPLLLGIGVDFSIHLVHRYRSGAGRGYALLGTSTSRGIMFSALTTTVSFASLAFLSHRGTASMGQLLVLSIAAMLGATLIVLPALLALAHGRNDRGRTGD